MFKPENLRKNRYLIYRTNPYFEINVKTIYEDRSVKAITQDRNIINKVPNIYIYLIYIFYLFMLGIIVNQ